MCPSRRGRDRDIRPSDTRRRHARHPTANGGRRGRPHRVGCPRAAPSGPSPPGRRRRPRTSVRRRAVVVTRADGRTAGRPSAPTVVRPD
ncbi:acyltransferase, partial [Micromonospora sp. KC207]